ncbi:MAG: hypothetical protein ACQCN5_09130 [Candidatus Bathyarchaeia archaeon]
MSDFGFGLLGGKRTKKQVKRDILEENKRRGKAAEDLFVLNQTLKGREVIRTGKGHDFRVRDRNLLTGRVVRSELHEVKSSKTAPLSKLQESTRKKKRVKVDRIDPFFY